jgi:hypothetical protein
LTSPDSDWLPLPRRVLLGISGFAAVVLLAALIYTAFEAEQRSSSDGHLKLVAAKLLPVLQLSGSGYDTVPSFYLLFRRFVSDERSALIGPAAGRLQRNQWAQVLVYDGRSLPPQVVLLSLPSHRPVRLDVAPVNTVLQKHQPAFTSAHAGGISIRAYLVPLKTPSIFQGEDVSAVLEVFQKS